MSTNGTLLNNDFNLFLNENFKVLSISIDTIELIEILNENNGPNYKI